MNKVSYGIMNNMKKEPIPPSEKAQSLQIGGTYVHYKNSEMKYIVLGVARHSETLEEMVVYKKLYDDYSEWVRPLEMFCGEVEVNGIMISRFTYTKD